MGDVVCIQIPRLNEHLAQLTIATYSSTSADSELNDPVLMRVIALAYNSLAVVRMNEEDVLQGKAKHSCSHSDVNVEGSPTQLTTAS